MSFINIINESFDKQNKKILAGSKGKKLKEAVEKYNNLDAIIITSELIDEVFKELRRKKLKPVAIYANNSELFIFIDTTKTLNSAFTLKEDNYEGISEEYGFEDDIDQLEALENTDKWIEKLKEWCYLEPWLGTVYEYDGEVISYDTETLLRESVESNSKNIKKDSKFLDNFNSHSDELDRFYNYMFEAAKDLGFQDFDAFDDGWTVTLTYIDTVGNKQQAEFDFDDELSFESKEDAIDCLMSLDWKVVDDEDTKSLHEYFDYGEAEDLDELDDMLDQSGSLIYEAAEKLGFKDFEWEDSVQGPYGRSDFWITGDDGTRLHAMVDFSETWVTDLDEAIMLLDNLEWEYASGGGDNDEVNDDLNKLKSLSYIPESFFSNSKIKSIDIPGNIKSIEREAFSNCKKLEDITFSVGLKDIGERAFYSCTHVEFIDFPESLITISDGAFMDCKSLISVTIPTSVKSIGDDAFSFCPRLYEIRYNGTHQDWQKIKLGKSWAFHSHINIIECTDGTLWRSGPDPTICDWVFKEKRDLDESIKNKKKLGRKFQSLKEASNKLYKYLVINHFRPGDYYMIKSDKPATEIGDWIFTDVSDEHGNGYVIWNRSEIEFHPNQSPQELDKLVYDKLIEYMRDAEKRDRLIDLIYRRHLDARDLGFNDEIFYYPLSFDTEDLFNDYRIDKSLSKYRHLFSDVIEKSRADRYSSGGIDYVNIDNLDNYADYYEFFKEDSEDEDEDKDEDTTISSYLQDKLEKLKNLDHIPDFFFGDSSIRSIVIPSNIKSIGDYAFVDCFDLKSITIPDSVTSIGGGAFENCRGLKNITISNSVTDIAEYAFASCAGLKNVIIPDSITHIRNATFYYCDSLTNVTLPNSIASIGTLSFAYCYELKEITYKGTKEDWNKIIKRKGWDYDSPIKIIHCTDGDIEIENKW